MISLLWLGGCSVVPPMDTGEGRLLWPQRQQALKQLQGWQLQGRVAGSTRQEGFNATLSWKQQPGGAYELRLIAPFGQGTVSLEGDDSGVMLRTSDTPGALYAADAESVLFDQFGWRVPVAALHFWVRGIPAPETHAELQLDHTGRLTELRQSGWKVRFLRYQQVRQWQLPDKIFIENGITQVRLVIQEWRVDEMIPAE